MFVIKRESSSLKNELGPLVLIENALGIFNFSKRTSRQTFYTAFVLMSITCVTIFWLVMVIVYHITDQIWNVMVETIAIMVSIVNFAYINHSLALKLKDKIHYLNKILMFEVPNARVSYIMISGEICFITATSIFFGVSVGVYTYTTLEHVLYAYAGLLTVVLEVHLLTCFRTIKVIRDRIQALRKVVVDDTRTDPDVPTIYGAHELIGVGTSVFGKSLKIKALYEREPEVLINTVCLLNECAKITRQIYSTLIFTLLALVVALQFYHMFTMIWVTINAIKLQLRDIGNLFSVLFLSLFIGWHLKLLFYITLPGTGFQLLNNELKRLNSEIYHLSNGPCLSKNESYLRLCEFIEENKPVLNLFNIINCDATTTLKIVSILITYGVIFCQIIYIE